MRRLLLTACLLASIALTACGGSDSSEPPPAVTPPAAPPVVPPAATPTASFSASDTAAANVPLAFDASASTSPSGSPLVYSWDFGDGQRGGGQTIAHVFASGGVRDVTLTVVDGAGRKATQSKSISVAGAAPPSAMINAQVAVKTVDGVAIEGVTVAPIGSAGSAVTDAMGKASLTLGMGVPVSLKLSKSGYADQFATLQLPSSSGADAYFEVTMRARDAATTLADAAAGGTVSGRDGATLNLPANALVNDVGAAVSGPVQISVTPVDVTLPAAGGFPGQFEGIRPDGTSTPIVSFGTTEFVLTVSGSPVQIAPGAQATIELPVYAALQLDGTPLAVGASVPLWSLDESTGVWIQEGTGTIVASAGSPSGLAMRASVSHLSWWNIDIGFDPYGPQPKCVYDTDIGLPGGADTFATATICNLLAEIDRGLGTAPAPAGLARALADPLPPRVAAFARRVVLPVAGGVTIAVPANFNVALGMSALNGTWFGRTVVNGPVGVQAEVLVKMRPLQSTGPAPEVIALPFDSTRSLQLNQTARYSFTGVVPKYVRLTASRGAASNLDGTVRLLRGATVLGSANFGAAQGQIVVALPANDTYVIEVAGTANAPGAYRLQAELLGGEIAEALTFPFDITKSLPAFTLYRGSFALAQTGALYLAHRPMSVAAQQLRITGPSGATLLNLTAATSGDTFTTIATPEAGNHVLTVQPQGGAAGDFRSSAEPTSWLPVAPPLPVDSALGIIDLIADRNGVPLLAYVRAVVGVNAYAVQLRRFNGTGWDVAASELIVELPCTGSGTAMSFTVDANNNPIIVYNQVFASSSGSRIGARRYSNGAWAALGPNDGILPNVSAFSGSCVKPVVRIDATGAPLVAYTAYTTNTNAFVQRFDGANWVDLGASTGVQSVLNPSLDLNVDASGRPVLIVSDLNTTATRAYRYEATAWQTLGSNAGTLPISGVLRQVYAPRIQFDASGNPVVGFLAKVYTSPGVFTTGVAVYRFDGTTWSTTGGFRPAATDNAADSLDYMGFDVGAGEAVMSFVIATSGGFPYPVVQKNTAAGWTPIGLNKGEIPQFVGGRGLTTSSGGGNRLRQIGNTLYLTLVESPGDRSGQRVVLLKKVGN